MGMKLTEKEKQYDFDSFTPPDEGWYVASTKKGEAELKDGGFKGVIECEISQGAYAGKLFWENFSTRTNDGKENTLGIKRLDAYVEKAGIVKAGKITDSDQFETQGFVDQFNKAAQGKLFGAYLIHDVISGGKNAGKLKAKVAKFRTVAEAQAEMGKMKSTPIPEVLDGKKAAAGNSSDWD